jgi:hypothetical protein
MRQTIKKFLGIALLTFGWQAAWGFALLGPSLGPDAAWQIPALGYNLGTDIGAPKNLGEEYRRNTPVMYYAYDANFLDYFGTNGSVAIDAAFTNMNAILTNGVDSYNYSNQSPIPFPFDTRQSNPTASALGLLDLKSTMLFAAVEQLGLADPVRYDWTLHEALQPTGGTCPTNNEYIIVQRNFDPITWDPTPYVNNVLYGYQIDEFCMPSPVVESVTVPISGATAAGSPVASASSGGLTAPNTINEFVGLSDGVFYGGPGLTWDDVGGLRYLMTTNNVIFESPTAGSLLEDTNLAASQLLTTSNLFDFALATSPTTNNPATLQALYPALAIDSVSNYFALVVTTNIVIYQTNYLGGAAGIESTVVANSYATNIEEFFQYSFGNVVTNQLGSTNTQATLQTITVAPANGSPLGSPNVTNITTKKIVLTGVPSGDFYFFPSNTCGYEFLQTLQTNVTPVTNSILSVTNGTLSYAENLITHFTNHIFVVAPCSLTNTGPALYQGIGKMQFVRADYDSLVGQYFQPITNVYTMMSVTNSQLVRQTFQRIVTQPDFLITAADLASSGEQTTVYVVNSFSRDINYDEANIGADLSGPGTINPTTTITFDKVGTAFYNGIMGTLLSSNVFSGTPASFFAWGSFNASTNVILYPTNNTIQNLQNQIMVQVSPTSLTNGVSGVAYPATPFTATGGGFTPPFTWSASGLPSGLTMSPAGMLSGTPTQSGTFDFVVQLTDTNARTVQWTYVITIE